MRRSLYLIALCGLAWPSWADSSAVLLSAYATSSAPGSTDPICLLDPTCKGNWTPAGVGGGVDEGLYFQFEEPVPVDVIEFDESSGQGDLRYYLNGKTRNNEGLSFVGKRSGKHMTVEADTRDDRTKPLHVLLQTLFIKIDGPVKFSIGQIQLYKFDAKGKRAAVAILLPRRVPAQAAASSVLDPTSAYGPSSLFDGRTDSAWATNGKKSKGIGETLTITFNEPQTLQGLALWNGYQRSSTHFAANARLANIDVRADNAPPVLLSVKNKMGPQKLLFPSPLTGQTWTVTIRQVSPGTTYPDVVLSEMRFVGSKGEYVMASIPSESITVPANISSFVDRSWTSIVDTVPSGDPELPFTFETRFRLRSNGTFVIYKGEGDYDPGRGKSAGVLEGNWEVKDIGLRIFGKKYSTSVITSEYAAEKVPATPVIFQSMLTLRPYGTLASEEKKKLFDSLSITVNNKDPQGWLLNVSENLDTEGCFNAPDRETLLARVDGLLTQKGTWVAESSVLTTLLLPTEDIGSYVELESAKCH